MHCRYLFGALALLVTAAGLTAALAPQDKSKEAKPASAPKMDDEMMAKFAQFGTPGPDHKVLDALAGRWSYTMKWWMEPGATPEESSGTRDSKWILDGRFLVCDLKGSSAMGPWEGQATSGFDNMKKKYVCTFIDNMGTAIITMEGTYDAATKTLSWRGEGPNVMAGKYTPMRMVEKFVDANKITTEFYCTDKTGKEFKAGETTYMRAK